MHNKIEIVENDADMLTVKVDGKEFVYNKGYGYWFDCIKDEIVQLDPGLDDEIFAKTRASDDRIEDNLNYVYHPGAMDEIDDLF